MHVYTCIYFQVRVQKKLERIRKLVENMKTGKQDGILHAGMYTPCIMHVRVDLFVVQTMCMHAWCSVQMIIQRSHYN